jgi:hypothetical protein
MTNIKWTFLMGLIITIMLQALLTLLATIKAPAQRVLATAQTATATALKLVQLIRRQKVLAWTVKRSAVTLGRGLQFGHRATGFDQHGRAQTQAAALTT